MSRPIDAFSNALGIIQGAAQDGEAASLTIAAMISDYNQIIQQYNTTHPDVTALLEITTVDQITSQIADMLVDAQTAAGTTSLIVQSLAELYDMIEAQIAAVGA